MDSNFTDLVLTIESWTKEHTLNSFARAICTALEKEQIELLIENLNVTNFLENA